MQAHSTSAPAVHRRTRYQRVVMFVALLFLSLQLLGAAQHKHAVTDTHSDCVACFVAHLPGGAPPAVAGVLAVAMLAGLAIAVLFRQAAFKQANYLTPPSHGPPSRPALL
jgi:Na+/phosphate symporter